jgi:hypothetical protein
MRRAIPAFSALALLAACATGGGGSASLPGLDLPEVGAGTTLAFGPAAKRCGLSGAALGAPVAREAGFTLYDTAPGTTAPRTHYLTGFDDGCAVQFTAALALFGDAATLEATAYGAGITHSPVQPAYEAVKAELCGVPVGQPCGRASAGLARNTTLLTAYAAFGASGRHADMLLHDGRLVARGVEG